MVMAAWVAETEQEDWAEAARGKVEWARADSAVLELVEEETVAADLVKETAAVEAEAMEEAEKAVSSNQRQSSHRGKCMCKSRSCSAVERSRAVAQKAENWQEAAAAASEAVEGPRAEKAAADNLVEAERWD